jgi:hypothetical protein
VRTCQEHAAVAVPVTAVLDPLHAAGTLLSPLHNAAQASAALNAAAAQWPAASAAQATSFVASGRVHPPLPDEFSYHYAAVDTGRGKRSSSPQHTDSQFF